MTFPASAPHGHRVPEGVPPLHLSPRMVLVVAGGALLGTAARYGLAWYRPVTTGEWPWATFTVNAVGTAALGFLLEALARRGDDVGRRRLLRLGVGTGFLGSFTTYSSLAVETDLLVHAHRPGLAAVYGVSSVVVGLLLALGGIAAAAGHHRWRLARLPVDPDSPDAGGSADENQTQREKREERG